MIINILFWNVHWLVNNKKCTINAFVIMPNHFHLLWKISDGFERKDVQGALFSFTAHEFKKYLKKNDPLLLEKHFVNKSDRSFQFWERESMVKECWTKKFFRQKLNYIHFNPCQPHWNHCCCWRPRHQLKNFKKKDKYYIYPCFKIIIQNF